MTGKIIDWGAAKSEACVVEALTETQEPYGYVVIHEDTDGYRFFYPKFHVDGIPVYTAPLKWQSLNNDELCELLKCHLGSSAFAIANAISEKLREKNS